MIANSPGCGAPESAANILINPRSFDTLVDYYLSQQTYIFSIWHFGSFKNKKNRNTSICATVSSANIIICGKGKKWLNEVEVPPFLPFVQKTFVIGEAVKK